MNSANNDNKYSHNRVEFGKVVKLVMPDKYEIPVEEIRSNNFVETRTTGCLDCMLICEGH